MADTDGDWYERAMARQARHAARRNWWIVPCGAEKAAEPVPARDLYLGSMFRQAFATATAAAGPADRVLILSALHGLVDPDTVVAPYDVRMGDDASVDADTIAAQAETFGIAAGEHVTALLPAAYFARLDAALKPAGIYAAQVYEADAGIGYQKGTLACIARH